MNALEKLVKTAVPVKVRPHERDEHARLVERIDAADALLGTLYPVEQTARERVESLCAPLREQFKPLARRLSGLPRVGLEPLTWRRRDGWPTLAVFSLKYPCVLHWCHDSKSVLRWTQSPARHSDYALYHCESGVAAPPIALQQCYADLAVQLRPNKETALKLIAQFGGIVPPTTREKIERYRSIFDDVYIITEPVSWTVSIERVDPVVVGWGDDSFWIIDAFDVTPAEEAFLALGER